MKTQRILMVLTMVAACGESGGKEVPVDANDVSDASLVDPLTRGFVSGSRLRAEVRVFDDEVRQLVRWWDNELNESCKFYLGSDGTRRCLPGGPVSSALRYADASCTEELVEVSRLLCQQSKYVRKQDYCGVVRTYLMGEIVTPTTVYFGGTCTPMTVSADAVYAKLGEAAPLSLFVASTLEREARGNSEIEAEVIVAEDGARELLRAVRASDGAVCSEVELTDLGRRCVPQPAILGGIDGVHYRDSACSELMASINEGRKAGCVADPVQSILSITGESCEKQYSVRKALAAFTGDAFYSKNAGQCVTVDYDNISASLYGVGEPWTDPLPELYRGNIGSGPVVLDVVRAEENGLPVETPRWLTYAATGEACSIIAFSDGIPRCLPYALREPGALYADAACTQGVTRINTGGSCEFPPLSIVLDGLEYPSQCSFPVATAVYRIGAKRDQPTYYSKDPACTAHAADPDSEYYEYAATSFEDYPVVSTLIE